eukprot:SAG31_NODE_627_length_13445_cov_18.311053_11_plen_59_part_00
MVILKLKFLVIWTRTRTTRHAYAMVILILNFLVIRWHAHTLACSPTEYYGCTAAVNTF